ncbi:unnamed protein product [Lathyrus sativus]|nr:unnamed protein product [Lathyrus sativus]
MFWFHGKRDRRSEYGESVCRYGVCLNGFEVTEWCFFYAVYSWFRFFRRNKSVVVTMLKVGERVLWVQQGWCLKIRLEWVPVFLKEDFGFVIAVGCSEEGDTEDDKTMVRFVQITAGFVARGCFLSFFLAI